MTMIKTAFKDVNLAIIKHNLNGKIYADIEGIIELLRSEESKTYIREMLTKLLHSKLDKVNHENQS